MWLEMFAWERKGPKVFRGAMSKDLFPKTTTMAANQGLYNGFLATGLLWSLAITDDPVWSRNIATYFFGCVFVAGAYGGHSAAKKIFFVQGLPALLGLLATQLGL
jgi:putative membrane protein